jgi:3-hydroxyisobutyrate dehydrogenase-like beta-hydroxyacid dehydrogenase
LLDTKVMAAYKPGAIVVDHGTSGVAAAATLAEGLADTQVRYLDAPVSGSVPSVLSGSLLVMASGDEATIEEAPNTLQAYARITLRVGELGAGQAMKLAVNLVVYDLNAAVSESLQLAEKSGIARDLAYNVLEESVVGAPFVKYKRAAFLDPDTPVAMSLSLVAKDLGLIQELARDVDGSVRATAAVAATVTDACALGVGADDMAALSRVPHAG